MKSKKKKSLKESEEDQDVLIYVNGVVLCVTKLSLMFGMHYHGETIKNAEIYIRMHE
jgi:hypothetical protein